MSPEETQLREKVCCSVGWADAVLATLDGKKRIPKELYPPGGKAETGMQKCPDCGKWCPPNGPKGSPCCDCELEQRWKWITAPERKDLWPKRRSLWWPRAMPFTELVGRVLSVRHTVAPALASSDPSKQAEERLERALSHVCWCDTLEKQETIPAPTGIGDAFGPEEQLDSAEEVVGAEEHLDSEEEVICPEEWRASEKGPRKRADVGRYGESAKLALRRLNGEERRHISPGCQLPTLPEDEESLRKEIDYYHRKQPADPPDIKDFARADIVYYWMAWGVRADKFASDIETVCQPIKPAKGVDAFRWEPTIVSRSVADTLLASDGLLDNLPRITGITRCPVLLERSGQLVQVTGYDPASGIYAAVADNKDGVGGILEKFDTKVLEGRAFISWDNLKGPFDRPALESFLTEPEYLARVPYGRNVQVDPCKTIVLLTSNAARFTEDFANRSSVIRLRKQKEGYPFLKYPEGDLLKHVEANRHEFLAAVFSVVKAWYEAGRPVSSGVSHDFRQWAAILDWIVVKLLGAAPLMQGHQEIKRRTTSPSLTWLRNVAHAAEAQEMLGKPLRPHNILDIICRAGKIEVPGLKESDNIDDEATRLVVFRAIGKRLADCMDSDGRAEVDEYRVERHVTSDAAGHEVKEYQFERLQPRRKPPASDPEVSPE
jgi:hypothetical protein